MTANSSSALPPVLCLQEGLGEIDQCSSFGSSSCQPKILGNEVRGCAHLVVWVRLINARVYRYVCICHLHRHECSHHSIIFTLGRSYYYNGRFRFLPEAVPGLGDKSGTLVMDRYVDNCDGYEAAMGNCLVMLFTYSRSLVAEQYSNSYDRRKQCMHFEAVGMKEKACAVCFLNCLRLHGQEDDEGGQQVQTDAAAAAAVACVRSSSSTRATEIINKEKNAASSSHSPSFLKKISKDDMNSTLVTLISPLSQVLVGGSM